GLALRAGRGHVARASGSRAVRAVGRAARAAGIDRTTVRTVVGSIVRTAGTAVATAPRAAVGARSRIAAAAGVRIAARAASAEAMAFGRSAAYQTYREAENHNRQSDFHGFVLSMLN